jgi:tetratricopeptide (TPR) repeat protein
MEGPEPGGMPAPLPGDPASVFRPIQPGDRDRAREPIRVQPPPKAPERRGLFPPEEPGLLRPLPPEADPQAEAARQITLGKEALAAGEYARAASRFRQAASSDPREPLALFLLAQAEFALGKYDEAFAAIEAGMKLKPDWPTADFRPLELYGARVQDFSEHLRRLEHALARYPEDAVLTFLYAYELWFDGRRDEAVPLLQRALDLAPGKTFIERFLRTRPAGPVVAR